MRGCDRAGEAWDVGTPTRVGCSRWGPDPVSEAQGGPGRWEGLGCCAVFRTWWSRRSRSGGHRGRRFGAQGMEIYVDNLAGMQFRNLNKMIEQTRVRLQNKGISDEDHYMKTLATASISEDNYFNNLLGNDIVKIAKDLRDAHSKDAETGDATTPVDDILDSFEELKTADNATQAQMIMYSKLFKINFTKMDPYEFKTFTNILQRYSDLCKPVKGTGRGKKKK